MNEIVLRPESELGFVDLTSSMAGADDLAKKSKAANTRQAYAAAWKVFETWCASKSLLSMPVHPETMRLYIYEMVSGLVRDHKGRLLKRRPSTVKGHLAAIRYFHNQAGLDTPRRHPRVMEAMEGAMNEYLGLARVKKDPVMHTMLPALIDTISVSTPIGIRDRAILLIGFGGAFRCDEYMKGNWDDVTDDPDGIVIHLLKSKRDQQGAGRDVPIARGLREATCAQRALAKWRETMRQLGLPTTGKNPIFVSLANYRFGKRLTNGKVSLILKAACEAAGLDPARFASHSLRSGWITSNLEEGRPMDVVMKKPGHGSSATTQGYDRRAYSPKNDPGRGLM